jgi:hypothetical protein
MLLNNPTRSERELYDCAPDYLDGEEDQQRADRDLAERLHDEYIDELIERRREK